MSPEGGGSSSAGLRRPATAPPKRTMAAERRLRGVTVAAERTSKSVCRGGSKGIAAEQGSDMETDCGPEDVIRWWSVAVSDPIVDSSNSASGNSEEVGNYECSQVGGHGRQMFSTKSNCSSVQVRKMHRQQRESMDRLSSDTPAEQEACCTTRRSGEGREGVVVSLCNCLKTRMLRLRHSRQPLLVTVLLCTYLMLSSMPAVAFAGRQQDGKWIRK